MEKSFCAKWVHRERVSSYASRLAFVVAVVVVAMHTYRWWEERRHSHTSFSDNVSRCTLLSRCCSFPLVYMLSVPRYPLFSGSTACTSRLILLVSRTDAGFRGFFLSHYAPTTTPPSLALSLWLLFVFCCFSDFPDLL